MNEKFSLIHTGGPYGDESSTYIGYLNYPLTVLDFIKAVLDEHGDEWGYIEISYSGERVEYSHGELNQSLACLFDYLDKKVESFTARGGLSRMDYALIVKN